MVVIDDFVESIKSGYNNLSITIPGPLFLVIQLFIIAILVVAVVFLIWGFYSTLSKRNFISLNLKRYNTSKNPVGKKLAAIVLYFIEYILFMPALIFFWFIAFSVILLLMAPSGELYQILLLSGGIVMAIRILAYIKEELSKELAKFFPLVVLSIYLLTPGRFSQFSVFDKMKGIFILFEDIFYFFVVIFFLEIVLRVGYTLREISKGNEELGK